MPSTDYEVLHPLRRDGVDSARGSVVQLEESEASPLVQGGVLRELPERKSKAASVGRPRKSSAASLSEENSEGSAEPTEE